MTESASLPPGRAILGGSFNPPHVGHLRLAIEAREALGDLVQGVDMVPCAVPPHKVQRSMLPFNLRSGVALAALQPDGGSAPGAVVYVGYALRLS